MGAQVSVDCRLASAICIRAMKFAAPLLVVASASTFEDIVAEVNSGDNGWEAQVPGKFKDVDDVKNFLGAFLPGDPRHEASEVMEVAVNSDIPDSFDSAENWPQCTVIA